MADAKANIPKKKKSATEMLYGTKQEKTIIDAKTAVKAAIAYLKDFSDIIFPGDIRLEEVELDDNNVWSVTLSFAESVVHERQYKRFRVDAKTGKVESMRNYSVPA